MSASNDGLSGYGWVATALSVTEGSAGDFLSSADIDPTRVIFNAAADALVSPRIFGSYDHGLVAARYLGYPPTKLSCEVYAQWTTATANENGSFFGFTGPSVTDATAVNSGAAIVCDGTNWILKSDNGTDTGALDDGSWHLFKIEVGATTTEWFIDGASQGTITTETDIWPLCFKAITTTTNRFGIAWVRIWYS